ncbi:YdcF family protein [Oceanithermus profundus]
MRGWRVGLAGLALLGALVAARVPEAAAEPRQALVLGAAQYDGVPSPVFRARLDAALELYRSGRAARIVVSGGRAPGDRFSEGASGCRYLEARGVPAAALACETESHSTWENLVRARPLLEPGPVWIVTDEPHLPRALLLARRLGLEARGWPVQGRFSTTYRLRERLLYALARLGFTH